jgi:hypothetical protein
MDGQAGEDELAGLMATIMVDLRPKLPTSRAKEGVY